MKEICAYQCHDGSIHLSEAAATIHEDDLLGQELDGLLRLFELDISRDQQFTALLKVMKKRDDLLNAARLIVGILEFEQDE